MRETEERTGLGLLLLRDDAEVGRPRAGLACGG